MSLGDIDDLMAGKIEGFTRPLPPLVEEKIKAAVKSAEAAKFDGGKPPLGLISRYALEQEAHVMQYGVNKYGTHNWRKGMDFSRLVDACLRHVYAFADGEDVDGETGLSHLAHARCCLAFLLEYEGKRIGSDDRYGR